MGKRWLWRCPLARGILPRLLCNLASNATSNVLDKIKKKWVAKGLWEQEKYSI